jgi:TonB family protein
MSGRDLLYSFGGHIIFALALFFIAPASFGLWSDDSPPPLFLDVSIVELPPGPRPLERASKSRPKIPHPAPDETPEIKPVEKLQKEKLGEKPAPDSVRTAGAEKRGGDTTKIAAVPEKASDGKTGEISHTIAEGIGGEGVDDIFGEYVPAVGYGGTDPYFQSLFLAIQRSFRNPVPGYKPIRCVVTFTVLHSGEIKNIKLEASSGIPRFDRAAIHAIEQIEWGRRFPKKFDDYDGYHITMPFEYVP